MFGGQQRTWGYGNEFDAVTVYTQHTHTHITKFGGVMVDGIKTLEFQNMF